MFERYPNNPILGPYTKNAWESRAVFNGCPVRDGKTVHLVYRALAHNANHHGVDIALSTIGYASSTVGVTFPTHTRRQLIAPEHEWEQFGCEDPRVIKIDDTYYITYTALSDFPHSADGIKVAVALTKDFKTIDAKHLVTPFNAKAFALFPQKVNGKYAAILTVNTDRPPVRIALALFDNIEDLWSRDYWTAWYKNLDQYTIHLRRSVRDHIEVGAPPVQTDDGWLFFYSYIRNYKSSVPTFGIETVLLDHDDPRHVILRSEEPLLMPEALYERHGDIANIVFPSGVLADDDDVMLYYGAADTTCAIANAKITDIMEEMKQQHKRFACARDEDPVRLERFEGNPIISPNPENAWESQYTLNPTAMYDEGKVHILYRAQDHNDTSYVGHAISKDGLSVDEKFAHPIYMPREAFELREEPGNSGCEDARITRLGENFYMCYTAYNGYGPARVALTSISVHDFRLRAWEKWSTPKLISPEGKDDKNACLVSERIAHQYVFFHRMEHKIWVDYVDTLDFDDRVLGGVVLMEPREHIWDSEKIGIAGPPFKVGDEWVLIYHALSKHDGMYRLGAALVDFGPHEATVRARLDYPILEPQMDYENKGLRPGTVFSCGSVVIDDIIHVYYGGADQYTCVATTSVTRLLEALHKKEQTGGN